MKRFVALLTAFLILVVTALTIGTAQAHPPQLTTDTDTPTPTLTATATTTTTSTPTVTSTTDPCSPKPPAAALHAPNDDSTVNQTQVKLTWSKIPCATKYKVNVHRDSAQWFERLLQQDHETTHHHLGAQSWSLVLLECENVSCGLWLHQIRDASFPLALSSTPVPQPTTPGGTPVPNGTPVPGVAPGGLLNTGACGTPPYPCRGVYLSSDSGARWYFNCSWKWVPYGGTVFTTSLWFYPNEGVSLRVQDFNKAQITQTAHFTANSNGYLEVSLDTSAWVQDHYHLLFNGDKSGVEYCGHFDLAVAGAQAV